MENIIKDIKKRIDEIDWAISNGKSKEEDCRIEWNRLSIALEILEGKRIINR